MNPRKDFNELTHSQQKETAFYLIDKNFNNAQVNSYTSSLFDCPIAQDLIENPVITPSGYIYEHDEIFKWVEVLEHKNDPLTRIEITAKDFYPENLFRLIKLFLNQSSANSLEELLPEFSSFLRCPLTGNFFREPVVACDGNTYEKSSLETLSYSDPYAAFLCKNPLYPSMIMSSILSIGSIQEFIKLDKKSKTTIKNTNKLIIALTEYFNFLQLRQHNDYTSLQAFLLCPLSGQVFKEPVMAEDGKTYERSELFLKAKTDEKYAKLARKLLQTNYFILSYLKVKEWIFLKSPLDTTLCHKLSQPMIDYMAKRKTERKYHYGISTNLTGFFGERKEKIFNRDEKLFAASSVICGLFYKDQAKWLLEGENTALAATKDGRLKKAAKPALQHLSKTQCLNIYGTPL